MVNEQNKPKTQAEIKAQKRADALRANLQRRKSFVRGSKEEQKDDNEKASD